MYQVEALPRATAKRKRKIKQKKLASANCCYLQEETVSLDGWSGYSGSIFIQLQHQGVEHVAKGGTLHDSSGMLAQHLFFFFGKCSVPAFFSSPWCRQTFVPCIWSERKHDNLDILQKFSTRKSIQILLLPLVLAHVGGCHLPTNLLILCWLYGKDSVTQWGMMLIPFSR